MCVEKKIISQYNQTTDNAKSQEDYEKEDEEAMKSSDNLRVILIILIIFIHI